LSKKKRISRQKLNIVSIITLLLATVAFVSVTYSWFMNRRELDTLAWIRTPIVLTIGSGNNHDIAYLDLGDIDVNRGNSADYVFCVYGEPVDIYSLQLAYTTNIAFSYEVYRADIAESEAADTVGFSYMDHENMVTEYFRKQGGSAVISAKPLYKMSEDEIKQHQSHKLSYGDDKGENVIDPQYVQSNAEPLYWLANEEGVNAMNPVNVGTRSEDGKSFFCDYYILHISWEPGYVVNDKETDMVYLTASR